MLLRRSMADRTPIIVDAERTIVRLAGLTLSVVGAFMLLQVFATIFVPSALRGCDAWRTVEGKGAPSQPYCANARQHRAANGAIAFILGAPLFLFHRRES